MINVGFIRTSVSINESQPLENVCFEVTSGVLDREVMVAIWPVDGFAMGERDRHTHTDTFYHQGSQLQIKLQITVTNFFIKRAKL